MIPISRQAPVVPDDVVDFQKNLTCVDSGSPRMGSCDSIVMSADAASNLGVVVILLCLSPTM